jgi:hypothetical protein
MKKILLPLVTAGLFLGACNEDFDVAAPYKDITVAYGILNRDDTAHYIRVEKAFLDENKSAIEMAQIADSSYYKNIEVVMKEYKNDDPANQIVNRTFDMYRVDMALEGYPKDAAGSQGFFTNPHYAYKLKLPAGDSLNAFLKYRVVVKNNNTGRTDSSDVFYVVNSNKNNDPNSFYIRDFTNANYQLSFSKTTNNAAYELSGRVPRNGKLLESIIRFHIVEKNAATGEKKRLSADYTYANAAVTSAGQFKVSVPTTALYSFIASSFGPAGANVQRYVDSCDLFVYVSSNEIYNYQQVQIAQGSGLLGDQIKPNYTNMRGENVLGLIGSRALRTYRNVPIETVTIDSLKVNPVTLSMNIQGRSDE